MKSPSAQSLRVLPLILAHRARDGHERRHLPDTHSSSPLWTRCGPAASYPALVKVVLGALLAWLAVAATGCATYSQDLERARQHYQALEFKKSLAVLRVLGEDVDALSPAERAQFAFLRGMTDLRLADTLPEKGAQRRAFRACARDWLDEALALDRAAGSSLMPDQRARSRAALAQLIEVEEAKGRCLE